jgi:hypothetical protein
MDRGLAVLILVVAVHPIFVLRVDPSPRRLLICFCGRAHACQAAGVTEELEVAFDLRCIAKPLQKRHTHAAFVEEVVMPAQPILKCVLQWVTEPRRR